MRVLIIVPRFHSNLVGVDRAFSRANISVTFLTSHVGPSQRKSEGLQIVVPESSRSDSWCHEILEQIRPNVLVVRETSRSSRAIWSRARLLRIPRVFYDQGPVKLGIFYFLVHPLKSTIFFLGLIKRFVFFGPNLRITPVDSWGQRGLVTLPNSKFLPLPVELTSNVKTVSKPWPPTVVCIAKHGHRRKRVRWLLRAVEQCPFQFQLILIGSSPISEVAAKLHKREQKVVNSLRRSGHSVQMVSDLSEIEITETLRRASLFVLPSRAEPFAISPLEAMSMGVPVLISRDSGNAFLVKEGLNGLTFMSHSYSSFYRKLTQLLGNMKGLRAMGAEGFEVVRRGHSEDEFIRWMLSMRRNNSCGL